MHAVAVRQDLSTADPGRGWPWTGAPCVRQGRLSDARAAASGVGGSSSGPAVGADGGVGARMGHAYAVTAGRGTGGNPDTERGRPCGGGVVERFGCGGWRWVCENAV
ncbi:hypothetical protein GCM10018962_45780 [Dactylosporangium matsuzakiense]|uniref:Uncharacterized protein n=1 Tax=Dactylosporangium matsuzakiense TaxID=53360 RepID=A0A9W6KMT5_9ACTN|nr:hypothetical protein GCM10017581_066680 [Dactylosporangium matsuzakiense]